FFLHLLLPPRPPPPPYTTLFRSATDREQNREAEHRCDEALSAEHQQRADPQTKHHTAATCANVSACISARSRGVFEPRTFTLTRSEEHTSELQSRENLVCRLLLE